MYYAVSAYAGGAPADGAAISYRSISDGDTLNTGEVQWSGDMPDYPSWVASTSAVTSNSSLYTAGGVPVASLPSSMPMTVTGSSPGPYTGACPVCSTVLAVTIA